MFAARSYKNYGVSSDPFFNNTSLLLHGDGTNGAQNNTFLDSSSTPKTITRSGTPTQGSLSPYPLNGVAYSPTLHGGSGYFPGVNGNYLSVPSNAGFNFSSGTFTVEFWVYFNSIASGVWQNPVGTYNSTTTGWLIQNNNKFVVNFSGDGNDIVGTTILQPNVWYHVAVSGSTGSYKLFLNGVQEGLTYTGATSLAGGILGIGANGDRAGYIGLAPVNGYISNLRITNGRACYTSNFTPPTSPVTLLSNGGATPSTEPTSGQVSLLCDFTNAGIFDNTKKNNLVTVGNAQISTLVKKYGTGSMYFDGTGDYLTLPSNNNFAFGTGDFTVECWYYPTASRQYPMALEIGNHTSVNGIGFFFQFNTNLYPFMNSGAQYTQNTNAIALNQWNHITWQRSSGIFKIFVNGSSSNSVAFTNNITLPSINSSIGSSELFAANIYSSQGYIDDLRITKGVARYTANFTPPTQAFPNQ